MHSEALYIGAYTHMADGYSCYSDPFCLTFYLLPLCLHSLLLAGGWRGAVAKHLKLMRLPSATHGPVCGWGSAGHSHLCLSFGFRHPFCWCSEMEDWAGVHDCLGSLWHLLHRWAVYLGINMRNPSLQCQDAGGAHVLSPGSYAHESWAQSGIANSVRPCDNSSNLQHFLAYAFFIQRIVMTTKLDKMQARVRLPRVPIPLAGQSVLKYKHSSDGWMPLVCTDMFAACLRQAPLQEGLLLTSLTGLDSSQV